MSYAGACVTFCSFLTMQEVIGLRFKALLFHQQKYWVCACQTTNYRPKTPQRLHTSMA